LSSVIDYDFGGADAAMRRRLDQDVVFRQRLRLAV
jgi:hypothetical protein